MGLHRLLLTACSMLVLLAASAAQGESLRLTVERIGEGEVGSGTFDIRFVVCASGCASAPQATVTIDCAADDSDLLVANIVCSINNSLSPTYLARLVPSSVGGATEFELFWPAGQCLCIDGQPLDASSFSLAVCIGPMSGAWLFTPNGLVEPPLVDCNNNGIDDATDILNCVGNDPECTDCNSNGIPDACDVGWEPNFESLDKYPSGDFPVALAGRDFDLDGKTDVGAAIGMARGDVGLCGFSRGWGLEARNPE